LVLLDDEILSYTIYTYWFFRGKIDPKGIPLNATRWIWHAQRVLY